MLIFSIELVEPCGPFGKAGFESATVTGADLVDLDEGDVEISSEGLATATGELGIDAGIGVAEPLRSPTAANLEGRGEAEIFSLNLPSVSIQEIKGASNV